MLIKALFAILVFSSVSHAQFILKPQTKLDWAMNAAYTGSYMTSIADSLSTVSALSNPVVRYRESNPPFNAFIDRRCACSQKRIALGLGYTTATNLVFHWAYRKSGENKTLKVIVILGRITASTILIPTIQQNYRNGKF